MGNKIYQQSRPSLEEKDLTSITMPNVARLRVIDGEGKSKNIPIGDFSLPAEQVTDIQDTLDSIQGAANDVIEASQVFDETHPETGYYSQSVSDGGIIHSKRKTLALFNSFIDSLGSCQFMWDGFAGTKRRVSGANTYASKIYSLDPAYNNGSQATESAQPYLGGLIAPNEASKLKFYDINDKILFQGAEYYSGDFTILLQAEINDPSGIVNVGNMNIILDYGAARIMFGSQQIYFASQVNIGKVNTIAISRKSSTAILEINGVKSSGSIGGDTFYPNYLAMNDAYAVLFNALHLSVFNKALSAAELSAAGELINALHPEVECVPVGSLMVATSNYEGTVDSDGTVIPEVQGASTASNPELVANSADRDFSSDTGYWGKLNGTTISGGKMNVSASDTGWVLDSQGRVYAGSRHNVAVVIDSISGILEFYMGYNSQDPLQLITAPGTYNIPIKKNTDGIFRIQSRGATTAVIDSISIKEIGWANLSTPAWCNYSNSPDIGAVYGKLYNWWASQLKAPKGYHFMTENDALQIIEELGGSTVAGGKMKEKFGVFDNSYATNQSGISCIASNLRADDGSFLSYNIAQIGVGDKRLILSNTDESASVIASDNKFGSALRLVRNEPYGPNHEEKYGITTTDISSSAKSVSIPHGYAVSRVRIKTTASLTNITAKLYDFAGNVKETLFTGVSLSNGEMVIPVTIAQSVLMNKGSVRFTAAGNSGQTTEFFVELDKCVFQ